MWTDKTTDNWGKKVPVFTYWVYISGSSFYLSSLYIQLYLQTQYPETIFFISLPWFFGIDYFCGQFIWLLSCPPPWKLASTSAQGSCYTGCTWPHFILCLSWHLRSPAQVDFCSLLLLWRNLNICQHYNMTIAGTPEKMVLYDFASFCGSFLREERYYLGPKACMQFFFF